MKTLNELIQEKRWPDDGAILQWNRGHGLVEMCLEIFRKRWSPDQYLMADVGIARGISTQIFRHFAKVVAVDREFWPETKEVFARDSGIEPWEGDSLDAAAFFRSQGVLFDAAYLDSDHSEDHVSREIRAWVQCIKDGGVICGHDYVPDFIGVQMAVAKELGGPDLVFQDGSWIKRL